MHRGLLLAIVVLLALNGLAMLGWPQVWYQRMPTVPYTGPFNGHFVRDIGCAYLASAGALSWYAVNPLRARPAALTGIAFLLAHAGVHVWDTLAGRCTPQHLAEDFAGVFVLPLLALWLVMAPRCRSRQPSIQPAGESPC